MIAMMSLSKAAVGRWRCGSPNVTGVGVCEDVEGFKVGRKGEIGFSRGASAEGYCKVESTEGHGKRGIAQTGGKVQAIGHLVETVCILQSSPA